MGDSSLCWQYLFHSLCQKSGNFPRKGGSLLQQCVCTVPVMRANLFRLRQTCRWPKLRCHAQPNVFISTESCIERCPAKIIFGSLAFEKRLYFREKFFKNLNRRGGALLAVKFQPSSSKVVVVSETKFSRWTSRHKTLLLSYICDCVALNSFLL